MKHSWNKNINQKKRMLKIRSSYTLAGFCLKQNNTNSVMMLTMPGSLAVLILLPGFFCFFFLMFIYFWERDRDSMSRGGAEREGVTESEAGSRFRAVSTEHDVGLELTDLEIMTWAEVGRLTGSATQAHLARLLIESMLFLAAEATQRQRRHIYL